jgi:hypothetical protein
MNSNFLFEGHPAEWFDSPEKRYDWWHELQEPWKKVFIKLYPNEDGEERQLNDEDFKAIFFERKYIELTYGNQLENNNKETSIQCIQNLTNLETIDIPESKIIDLSPLENLHRLKGLFLSGNNIKNIQVLANLKAIEQLYLDQNSVKDITPIEELSKLRVLNLNYNNITDIKAVRNLTKLTHLFLAHNSIQTIEYLSELNKIVDLNLSNNKISNPHPIKKLKQLKILDLENNQISSLDFLINLKHLISLKIRGCPISIDKIQDFKKFNSKCKIIHDYLSPEKTTAEQHSINLTFALESISKNRNPTLPDGEHSVVIEMVKEFSIDPPADSDWKDSTSILRLTFKNEIGTIDFRLNLIGYQTIDDYDLSLIPSHVRFGISSTGLTYAINKNTDCRIENSIRTANAYKVIKNLKQKCGIKDELDFQSTDLIGHRIIIKIEEGRVQEFFALG